MPISEALPALHRSERVAALGSGVFARNDQRKQAYRAGAVAAGLPALLDLSLGSTDLQPPEAAIQAIRDQLGRPESAAYCLHGATLPFREAVAAWLQLARLGTGDYLFPSRQHESPHISTRQYARMLQSWIVDIGHDPSAYGTHSLRRTKATLIYRRTKNLRAVQLLLGHTKLESTVRYLGIELVDALEIAEQTEA